MTPLQKAWETRRAKYGPGGGCRTPVKLDWIPASRRGRYDSLRRMHGALLAREIMKLELGYAS
jgi:hypothetical protein